MDITFLYYITGIILLLVLRTRVALIKREKEIDARVEEYLTTNTKFVRIEKIEESTTPLFIAYNYLTNDFVAQGVTDDEVKANISAKWPALTIFIVTADSTV